ncbi:hypothetical protein EDD34_2198 [Myceligenerans xiligouense]|uniref:Uncharacterized protein n=2 Tax=Myceligenerans xiligouense TaxID=253184 RepID=A0A3N4YN75_9MICO|nr:hypothetical protein EDD34_2198 [Myceligenerans xiligouense]
MQSADIRITPTGDAVVLVTAPIHSRADALAVAPPFRTDVEPGERLGSEFVVVESSLPQLFSGTLTYDAPKPHCLELSGTDEFLTRISTELNDQDVTCTEITLLFFDDGYGAVAVTYRIAGGWGRYGPDLKHFGRDSREDTCEQLRRLLLQALAPVYRELSEESSPGPQVPYFNMTYGGETDAHEPGRGHLAPGYRDLVYPNSPEPLRSMSPWRDQFFYAGYAYSLIFGNDTEGQVRKFSRLLMLLGITYSRLARTSASAKAALIQRRDHDVLWLQDLARWIRSSYQDLVTPTFSFDFHALCLRDAILRAWSLDVLHRSAEDLLLLVRATVEDRIARSQARRSRWINVALAVLTALSLISTIEAAVNLWNMP